jgi:ion channel
VLHYEVLRLMSFGLPRLAIRPRAKLLLVIFGTFISHALQMLLYAAGYALLADGLGLGKLSGGRSTFTDYLYFSAETYTSLGFGDLIPIGPLRLMAGVETLNGLLLIGWSASYIYISMERFWTAPSGSGP